MGSPTAVLNDEPFGPGDFPIAGRRGIIARAINLPVSLALHALLLLCLAQWTAMRPIEPPPLASIDVQVLSEQQYRSMIEPLLVPPRKMPSPLEAPAKPTEQPKALALADHAAPGDGMTHATHLFSTGLLKEPSSRQVRETLPKLAPYERMTQLCNIEATEQIRHVLPKSNPETVAASAFAETTLQNGTLVAPGAAYRSNRKWYALRFECIVKPDLTGVADFRFATGALIPEKEWDSHNLLAAGQSGEDDQPDDDE